MILTRLSRSYGLSVDVYSFSFVLYAAAVGDAKLLRVLWPKNSGKLGAVLGWRPEIPKQIEKTMPTIAALMKSCWSADASARPDFDTILQTLKTEHERLVEPLPGTPKMSPTRSLSRVGLRGKFRPADSLTIIAPLTVFFHAN